MAEAAQQSAQQCVAIRAALRVAKHDEEVEKEKETKRMKKEAEQQEKRQHRQAQRDSEKEKKKKEKEIEKAKKKQEKEQAEATAAAEGAVEKEKNKGRRRAKGADELIEGEDPPCLTNKLADSEVPVTDSLEAFISTMVHGIPVQFRARRSPLKKIIEKQGIVDPKLLNSASVALQREWKAHLSAFAEEAANNADVLKRNKACTPEVMAYMNELSLDQLVQSYLEEQAMEETDEFDPCSVMERPLLEDILENAVKLTEQSGGASADKIKPMQNEIQMYTQMHTNAFAKGKRFAGVYTGLFPHVHYQMEGTKAMALMNIKDVTWFRLLSSLCYTYQKPRCGNTPEYEQLSQICFTCFLVLC